MNKNEMRERAYEYAAGELPAELRAEFERTLETDAEARDHLAQVQSLDRALATWEAPAPADDFVDRVLAQVQTADAPEDETDGARRETRTRYWRIPSHVGMAAAIFLVVSASFNVLWVLYRDRLLQQQPDLDPSGRTAVPVTRVLYDYDQQPGGYYFLDPTDTDLRSGDDDAPEGIGP